MILAGVKIPRQSPCEDDRFRSKEHEPGNPIRTLLLGLGQVVSASVCLFFLITTGESSATFVSAAVALLVLALSLTFKLRRRDAHR